MPLLILFVIFIVVPLAELYVIIQVGEAIGVLWTIALLLADSILGSMLMRSQGRAVWRRFNAALRAGRPPAREIVDGALVILGGAFLVAPGFLTDVVGVLLLLPPTRAAFRAVLVRRFSSRLLGGFAAGPGATFAGRGADGRTRPSGRSGGRGRGYDVDATAREVDPPELR